MGPRTANSIPFTLGFMLSRLIVFFLALSIWHVERHLPEPRRTWKALTGTLITCILKMSPLFDLSTSSHWGKLEARVQCKSVTWKAQCFCFKRKAYPTVLKFWLRPHCKNFWAKRPKKSFEVKYWKNCFLFEAFLILLFPNLVPLLFFKSFFQLLLTPPFIFRPASLTNHTI